MGTNTNNPGLKLLHDKQKPILIHGVPGRLQGTLNIRNDSESKVTLKSMPIEAPELRSLTMEPLNEVRLFGRLYPKQQGNVYFELPLDPSTPPGTYEATVQVGEINQTATILISENYELEVEPDEITLVVKKDLTFSRDFIFSNVGNVAITLDGEWPLLLRLQQGLDVDLISGLHDICQKRKSEPKKKIKQDDQTDEQSLTDILCRIADKQPEPAIVSFKKTTIEPGESKHIETTIKLPDKLLPNNHYTAEIDMYSANIQVDVYMPGQ